MKQKTLIILLFITNILIGQHQQLIPQQKIQHIVDKATENKNIQGAVVCIHKGLETALFSAGKIKNQDQYFIASVTKLYTSAIIFKLQDEGKLKFDDLISNYLSVDIMQGIHMYKDVDYSNNITIRHLLSNTSGLPDYFDQKQPNGKHLKNDLAKNNDISLSFNEIINISKTLHPKFKPGEKQKAFYSDVNFQLLGKIITTICNMTLEQAYQQFIFDKLALKKTYLYTSPKDTIPTSLFYKTQKLSIPKMMASFTSDGGIVSTAQENMIFLQAFFNGQLFSIEHIHTMKNWNKIHFPFKYGLGVAKFKIYKTELIGHPGASGSFAYYVPQKDIYITGTINQLSNPALPYKLMMSILDKL